MEAHGHATPDDYLEIADPEGEPYFLVQGVRCKAESHDMVRMGMQLSSTHRVPVRMLVGQSRAEAVIGHTKFPMVKRLVSGVLSQNTYAVVVACIGLHLMANQLL